MKHELNFGRRAALKAMSSGFGYLAFAGLSSMAAEQAKRGPLAVKQPHFAPRAKRVIFMSMQGAPSHLDTFDYKPQLAADQGKAGKYGQFRGAKLPANILTSPIAPSMCSSRIDGTYRDQRRFPSVVRRRHAPGRLLRSAGCNGEPRSGG